MKLQILECRCQPSGHMFRVPELPIAAYGEFLLRDETGTFMAYLNAIYDPTYRELDSLLQQQPGVKPMTPNKRAELLRAMYGAVACDAAVNGRVFNIGWRPKCPACSSTVMHFWKEVEPEEFVDLDVTAVSHVLWQSLSEEQKIARLSDWMTDN